MSDNPTGGMDRATKLAGDLVEARQRKADLAQQLSAANADIASLETQLCDLMLSAELGKFTYRGATFYMSERLHVSGKADRKDDLIEYLDVVDAGHLARRTVHAQSLGAYVREVREQNGGTIPEDLAGLLNVHTVPTISVRKA